MCAEPPINDKQDTAKNKKKKFFKAIIYIYSFSIETHSFQLQIFEGPLESRDLQTLGPE
jgi:hypothetical protein